MTVPQIVQSDIDEILKLLESYTQSFLNNNITKDIKWDGNSFNISWGIPLEREYKDFVYKTLKYILKNRKDQSVYKHKHCINVILILIKGYQMPVNVYFNANDNIYNKGIIKCGVWINTYVAQKIEGDNKNGIQ